MLTLGPNDTLSGSSSAAVTCTITGDSVTDSVDDFRVLYQGDLGPSVAVLIGSGSSQRLVKTIIVSNDSALSVGAVKLFVGAGRIMTLSIPSGGTAIYDDSGWSVYDDSGILSSGAVRQTVERPFAYGDATPATIVDAPANRVIISSQIIITESFNGTGSALKLGDVAVLDRLIAESENAPGVVAAYETAPIFSYGSSTPILLTITPGSGATQGRGLVQLEFSQ